MSSTHQAPLGSQSRGVLPSWPISDESAITARSRCDLLENLKDPEYRDGFVESHVYTGVAFQIRAIREKRKMTQAEAGRAAHMAQERISILEDPNSETKPTLKTLLRIARAFDVGLQVRFAPFRQLIDEAVRTDEDDLNVVSFKKELDDGLERDLLSEKQCSGVLGVVEEALSPKDGNRPPEGDPRQEDLRRNSFAFYQLLPERDRTQENIIRSTARTPPGIPSAIGGLQSCVQGLAILR